MPFHIAAVLHSSATGKGSGAVSSPTSGFSDLITLRFFGTLDIPVAPDQTPDHLHDVATGNKSFLFLNESGHTAAGHQRPHFLEIVVTGEVLCLQRGETRIQLRRQNFFQSGIVRIAGDPFRESYTAKNIDRIEYQQW